MKTQKSKKQSVNIVDIPDIEIYKAMNEAFRHVGLYSEVVDLKTFKRKSLKTNKK